MTNPALTGHSPPYWKPHRSVTEPAIRESYSTFWWRVVAVRDEADKIAVCMRSIVI